MPFKEIGAKCVRWARCLIPYLCPELNENLFREKPSEKNTDTVPLQEVKKYLAKCKIIACVAKTFGLKTKIK